jgi:LysR family transcriptional regulator, glycine cleavage system transcriptional activator
MARDLLPSIGALTAFESAARHLSFSRAAAELHLTQGAVSRQIRELETRLGLSLFERLNQRVFLTDAGAAYAKNVGHILADLAAATERTMASAGGAETLNLAVLPTFAARWLVPRLPAFLAAHPQATVNFSVRNEPFAFADTALDAAIHFGEPTWPGAICDFLCVEEVYPVAAPDLRRRVDLSSAAAIAQAPLLHQSSRPTAWSDWFDAEGLPAAGAYRGSRFDQFLMIAEAAMAGMGVALMPRFMIEPELADGRLVLLTERPLDAGKAYWFVYPEVKARSRLVRSFGEWLTAAAAMPARGQP